MQILVRRHKDFDHLITWEKEYKNQHGCLPPHDFPEDLEVGEGFIVIPQRTQFDNKKERKAGGLIGWIRSWATRRKADGASYSVIKQRIPVGKGVGAEYKIRIDTKVYQVVRTK